MSDTLEQLCRQMHADYEKAATKHRWETNTACRVTWDSLPESNKATMRDALRPIADEIERLRGLLREVFGESRLTDQLNWPGDLRERVREALGERDERQTVSAER